MKGGFLEIPKALSFWPDVLVCLAREELLGMPDLGWRAQHRGAVLCSDTTPSCFVARTFPGYYYLGINMLDDAFRDLLHPKLRTLVTMSVRGGSAYECMQHG